MRLLFLSRNDVDNALSMSRIIDVLDSFFRESPQHYSPDRIVSRFGPGIWLFMPAHVRGFGISMKVVNEYPAAPTSEHAYGLIELYDEGTGAPLAIMDSVEITKLRTGALGGLAIKYMAGKEGGRVGVIGSGIQAEGQLRAAASVFKVEEAVVYSRSPSRRESFATSMSRSLGIDVVPVDDPRSAVTNSDLIITATNSSTPVLDGSWITPGAHVNSLGVLPDRMELDDEAFRRASAVVFDTYDGVTKEAGDVIHAMRTGALDSGKIVGDLELVVRTGGVRRGQDDITIFKSVGIAHLDTVTAAAAYESALAAGVGTVVDL